MANITPERVNQAYEALASGDIGRINEYWAEDMNWHVPGHNRLSGWYHGRSAFLAFMGNVGQLSGNSFNMQRTIILTSNEYSADVSHNLGYRAGSVNTGEVPYQKLDINVIHLLRWQGGKVVEGQGAIFGDGTAQYDQFWSHIGERG
jgi:ketosteroid isomerase-like protein